MKIESPSFEKGGIIPEKFGCDKEGINPPFKIADIPSSAKSLALVSYDEDIKGKWTIWLVWNINPNVRMIAEGDAPFNSLEGVNSWGKVGYGAICPTHLTNRHRYTFWLFALDEKIPLPAGSTKSQFDEAIKRHVIAKSHTSGIFKR
jgi:Raf kinase inhibitor-like YbhB/YbcL family protein